MSITIDSLDIQIRSSAGNAADKIEDLAIALTDLKGAANLNKVINQLSRLKTSLDGLRSVNSGIQSLERFGKAIKNLGQFTGNVSGFSKAVNTLRKLPQLAGELKSVDFSGFSSQMQALESGMSGLSGIAGPKGLTSSLNALKKIPEITSSLNPQIIDEFGDKIEKLSAKLAPLATQIDKVGNAFSKLPSQVSKTVTATNRMEQATRKATEANKKHDKSLNTKSVNLMATIQNLQEYAQAINFVADGIGNVMNDAMQWDGIQFRFGRAFGEDAEEVLAYSEKISEKLGINQQQFMQYSSMYGSLLSGFGMAQEQVTTISVGLAELSYDIWAAYNDRYQSLEDASEAVRSAITGEIEPIRNAGIALTEASMQEYLDSLGMAHIKISNLSEAQKSEVRYATMVNAAMNQGIVGTYAAEMNTAEGVMRNLAMQTKTLAQNLGSLFIPVLMKVIPYVTAFVQILTDATRAIAGFFGVELQKIDWGSSVGNIGSAVNDAATGVGNVSDGAKDATGALKDAAEEAKKLKDYTLGFDELNVISPDDSNSKTDAGSSSGSGSGSGVGGGSLGLDLDTLWDESVFAKAQESVAGIKEKLEGILGIAKLIATAIAGWMIAGKLLEFWDWMKDPKSIGDFKKKAGLTLMITGLAILWDSASDLAKDFNLENALKTLLASAMVVGGSLLTFGTGPLGWTIGIVAALTVGITSFAISWNKEQLLKDQKEHFGDYVLSDKELQELVDGIMTSKLSLKLDLFVDQQEVVETAEANLEEALKGINKLNIKAELGLDVSQEEYTKAANEVVSNAKKYLEEKQIEAVLAIDVVLGGTETGNRLTEFANIFFAEQKTKLTELGTKLKGVVATGFKDGEWIPEKLQEAIKLQKEIQEVVKEAADLEYEAKMTALKLDVKNAGFSYESIKSAMSGLAKEAETQLQVAMDAREVSLQMAIKEYDVNIAKGMPEEKAKEIYNEAEAAIQTEFLAQEMEITLKAINFGTEQIYEAYAKDLKNLEPLMQKSTEELFVNGVAFAVPDSKGMYENIDVLISQTASALTDGIGRMELSNEAKENIKNLMVQMEPQVKDWKKLADKYRNTGKKIPENVAAGLADYETLKMLLGDADGLNYMLGQKFSTDSSFLNMLATTEGAGKKIPETMADGILDNAQLVYDDAGEVLIGIKNTATDEITKMTPTLYKNMKELGVNLPEGLYEGANDEIEANKPWWQTWANKVINWFRGENDINSPSKVFYAAGEDLSQGLFNGSDDKMSSLKSSWNTWAVWPWNWFKSANGISTGESSIFKTLGEKLSGGLFAGSDADLKAKETSWKTWSLLPRNWFKTENGIKNGDSTEFSALGKKIAGGLFSGVDKNTKQSDYTSVFGQLSSWFSSTFGIGNGEESKFAKLGESLIGNLKTGLSSAWEGLKTWWAKLELPSFKIKTPHITWSSTSAKGWIAETLAALGLPTSIPKMNIEWYANGGFPDMGQMFIAREAGPELVGSINGRTAVANNDQIVAAVSQGVYSAVVAAMGNNNGSGEQHINVYLDGKQITASVEKRQAERGRTLMGNQLGYGY